MLATWDRGGPASHAGGDSSGVDHMRRDRQPAERGSRRSGVTVGSEPLFATVKGDRRARIQETAINAEALLPGGPYDLWRDDEPSRRVKDLASAFRRAPPACRRCCASRRFSPPSTGALQDGLFVASLPRPDRTVKTWWRAPVDEADALGTERWSCSCPAGRPCPTSIRVSCPRGLLPELWDRRFPHRRRLDRLLLGRDGPVMAPREGYDEPVDIPGVSRRCRRGQPSRRRCGRVTCGCSTDRPASRARSYRRAF